MLIYIHGYGSSGVSDKARHYQKLFEGEAFLTPTLSTESRLAVHTLENLIQTLSHHGKMGLIGSSLGGYFAIYLAHKYKLPAVLINPAIPPWDQQAVLDGVNRPNSSHSFSWQNEHLERLSSFRVASPSQSLQKRLLLLQQLDDEVLDAKLALDYLPQAPQIVTSGGGHRFRGIEQYDQKVLGFFAKFLKAD